MRNYIDPEKLSKEDIEELASDIISKYNEYLDSVRKLQFMTEENFKYLEKLEETPDDRLVEIKRILTDCNCLILESDEAFHHANLENDVNELTSFSEEEEDEDN